MASPPSSNDPGPWREVPNREAIRKGYRGGQGKYAWRRMGKALSSDYKKGGF
jgi:hypothetical protein